MTTTIAALLTRIDAHEAEQAAIDKDMAALNIDAKGLKKIRRAREDAERAQATLNALMGAGLVPVASGASDPHAAESEPEATAKGADKGAGK